MGLIKKYVFFFLFLLSAFSFADSQNAAETVSLPDEIARLERLTRGALGREKYSSFLSLARLLRLSGDSDAALKTCEDALALFPGDGRFLLEKTRLLISLGEHEKTADVLSALASEPRNQDLLTESRYLAAQMDAFASSNTFSLASLADDDVFSLYRSGIFYTLWKLTGLSAWKNRLAAEFSGSPEAKIASAVAGVEFAPSPLWLFYPGGEILTGAETPSAASSEVSAVQQPGGSALPATRSIPANFLQAGLFGREENAATFADRLKNAGFEPHIVKRQVNGGEMLAVGVSGGSDIKAVIQKLKAVGFESFPLNP